MLNNNALFSAPPVPMIVMLLLAEVRHAGRRVATLIAATLIAAFRYKCLVFPDSRIQELAEVAANEVTSTEEERALAQATLAHRPRPMRK